MKKICILGGFGIVLLSASVYIPKLTTHTYEVEEILHIDGDAVHAEIDTQVIPEKPVDARPLVRHVPLPEHVRAIYMTACIASVKSLRERLVTLIDETEVNAVIIDIKDFSGTISFPPTDEAWKPAWNVEEACGAPDMKDFIEVLHEKNIFVIGRITVFQDPFYTKVKPELAVHKASDGSVWRDKKGLSFIDVGSQPYWDHIVMLSRDAYNIGFDELNFDYVRYPSDGNMQDIAFSNSLAGEYGNDKQANLEAFFQYLDIKLSDPKLYTSVRHENTGKEDTIPWTSADLFGMTTTNTDDLSIGQVQERAAPYFDFILPMVYPSHYPHGFLNLGNPNEHPYKIVHHAMSSGVRRMISTTTPVDGFLHERIGTSTPPVYTKPAYTAEKFRTWIQDFDYGGDYDATDVRAQIQASYDAGVHSWIIWSPTNIYTREALLNES